MYACEVSERHVNSMTRFTQLVGVGVGVGGGGGGVVVVHPASKFYKPSSLGLHHS